MMGTGDWAAMRSDLQDVVADNSVSITLRRGATTLAAQTVRIARTRVSNIRNSPGAQQSVGPVVVVGDTTLDIQVGDRFTVANVLYEVEFVRPNRRAMTAAEVKAVQ